MKRILQLLGTTLILLFALQGTVFASVLTANNEPSPSGEVNTVHKNCKPSGHYNHSAYEILKNKYKVTDKEFEEAKANNKTFFDIAKSKGIKEDDLKESIIAPKLKALEAMVKTGEITKEKFEEIKSKIKDRISKWDGKIEDQKKHGECHKKENTEDNKEQAS